LQWFVTRTRPESLEDRRHKGHRGKPHRFATTESTSTFDLGLGTVSFISFVITHQHKMDAWEDDFGAGPSQTQGGAADPIVDNEYARIQKRYTDVSKPRQRAAGGRQRLDPMGNTHISLL
jgi:hypothetical protein